MDFELTDEQRMLIESVDKWLASKYDFDQRRSLAASATAFSDDHWRTLAELGLLGIEVPSEYEGLGGNMVDAYLILRQMGRALVLEPYRPTALTAARLLVRAGSAAQRKYYLPGIVNGARRFAIAALEASAGYDLHRVETMARRDATGYVLEGTKAVVLHGDAAHSLIVSARLSGAADDRAGIGLFLLDREQAGLTVRGFPALDGSRVAEIALQKVRVESTSLLGLPEQGLPLLEWAVDQELAGLCAEAVGAMEKLLELTVEHLRTRRQFGQAIGQFQVLQHRIADMLCAVEQARSMALRAAAYADIDDTAERRRAMSAAKAMIGRSARFVGQQAVQLHGGMGMTDESPVGHYFKRLTCIDISWGNADYHTALVGALL